MVTYVASQVGVRVEGSSGDVELSGEVLDFVDEADDGLELLVGFRKSGLELSVGVDQTLDLVQGVHDEHVDQVLAGSVQPVVERLQRFRAIINKLMSSSDFHMRNFKLFCDQIVLM